jgi:hypothetical protein
MVMVVEVRYRDSTVVVVGEHLKFSSVAGELRVLDGEKVVHIGAIGHWDCASLVDSERPVL